MTKSRPSQLQPSALSIRHAPAWVSVVLVATVAIALACFVSTVPGRRGRPGTIPFREKPPPTVRGDRLRELGCDLAQGFLVSRPLPPRDLDAGAEARRPAAMADAVRA